MPLILKGTENLVQCKLLLKKFSLTFETVLLLKVSKELKFLASGNVNCETKAMEFYNLLETTLVNQNLPKQFQTNGDRTHKHPINPSGNAEINMALFEDKRHKADYISLQLAFMQDLTNTSLKLKDPSIGKDKNGYLFRELKRINEWVDTNIR